MRTNFLLSLATAAFLVPLLALAAAHALPPANHYTFDQTFFPTETLDVGVLGVHVSSDGSRMFIGMADNTIIEYSLSPTLDLSSPRLIANHSDHISFGAGVSYDTFQFSHGGNDLYITSGDTIYQIVLDPSYDISVSSTRDMTTDFTDGVDRYTITSPAENESFITGIAFNNNGTKMYVSGEDVGNIEEYQLTSAYNISTAMYTDLLDFDGDSHGDAIPTALLFNSEGTRMFVAGSDNGRVYEYRMTPADAFDISTATFVAGGTPDLQLEQPLPNGIATSPDGILLFSTTASLDASAATGVRQYSDIRGPQFFTSGGDSSTPDAASAGDLDLGTGEFILHFSERVDVSAIDVTGVDLTLIHSGGDTVLVSLDGAGVSGDDTASPVMRLTEDQRQEALAACFQADPCRMAINMTSAAKFPDLAGNTRDLTIATPAPIGTATSDMIPPVPGTPESSPATGTITIAFDEALHPVVFVNNTRLGTISDDLTSLDSDTLFTLNPNDSTGSVDGRVVTLTLGGADLQNFQDLVATGEEIFMTLSTGTTSVSYSPPPSDGIYHVLAMIESALREHAAHALHVLHLAAEAQTAPPRGCLNDAVVGSGGTDCGGVSSSNPLNVQINTAVQRTEASGGGFKTTSILAPHLIQYDSCGADGMVRVLTFNSAHLDSIRVNLYAGDHVSYGMDITNSVPASTYISPAANDGYVYTVWEAQLPSGASQFFVTTMDPADSRTATSTLVHMDGCSGSVEPHPPRNAGTTLK